MSPLDRLEKRFGSYAAPHLTLWLLAGQALVFFAQYIGPMAEAGGAGAIFERLALDPQAVFKGEWWRLFTFVFLAPLGRFPLFAFFFFWFFYFIGTTLENTWGTFRYNAYLAIGYLATVGAAFLAHAIQPGAGLVVADFLFGSLFLAFARLFPEFEIYLFFILPVKIKWLARLQWLFYWMTVLFGDWHMRLTASAAIANYLFFFGRTVLSEAKQGHRQMKRRAKTLKAPERFVHECRVCGLTSDMDPRMSFRYCSKCYGQCCYCAEHIRDHECVKDPAGERPEATADG